MGSYQLSHVDRYGQPYSLTILATRKPKLRISKIHPPAHLVSWANQSAFLPNDEASLYRGEENESEACCWKDAEVGPVLPSHSDPKTNAKR